MVGVDAVRWTVAGQEAVLQGAGGLAALRVPLLLGGEWGRVAEVGFERKGRRAPGGGWL